MGTEEMFEELPKAFDVGTKMNSKDYKNPGLDINFT
jgi:hypothetical protein